jgi:VanZ family protein
LILTRVLVLLVVASLCLTTIVAAPKLEPGKTLKLLYRVAGNIPRQEADVLNVALRKGAHLLLYAVVAGLLFLALARRRSAALAGLVAWLSATAWGAVDEWHQRHVATRTGSVRDVLLDSVGAAVAVLILGLLWYWRSKQKQEA